MKSESIVRVLTRDALQDVAEDEVMLLDGYDPAAYGSTARGPQGMGVEMALSLVLPFLYTFFNKLLESLAEDAAVGVAGLIKQWLRRDVPATPELELAVRRELEATGIAADKLDSAASAVVKVIATHKALLAERAESA